MKILGTEKGFRNRYPSGAAEAATHAIIRSLDMLNLVELIEDPDECAFDQPCKYGHRVSGHAVYCHNTEWKGAPRKCRQSRYWGKVEGKEDEDCPGFEPNPNYKETLP